MLFESTRSSTYSTKVRLWLAVLSPRAGGRAPEFEGSCRGSVLSRDRLQTCVSCYSPGGPTNPKFQGFLAFVTNFNFEAKPKSVFGMVFYCRAQCLNMPVGLGNPLMDTCSYGLKFPSILSPRSALREDSSIWEVWWLYSFPLGPICL